MKLLILLPSIARGGAEEYALSIARGATIRNWDVHAAFPLRMETKSIVSDLKSLNVAYHELEIPAIDCNDVKRVFHHLAQMLRTMKLIKKVSPDRIMIVLPYINLGFAPLMSCRISKTPTLAAFQLVVSRYPMKNVILRIYKWILKKTVECVAVSKNNKELLMRYFQKDDSKVRLIYNGFKPSENLGDDKVFRARLCEEFQIPVHSKLLLTVGRLSKQKGYDLLAEVIPDIQMKYPDIRWVWAGPDEMNGQLQARFKSAKFEKNVFFLGYRTDVPGLLQACDLFIFPTRYEGHPFALLEAMSAGIPVVTSDASSNREIIENMKNGLLFKSEDSGNLKNMILYALENSEEMKEMAGRARNTVQRFSEENMVRETLDCIYGI